MSGYGKLKTSPFIQFSGVDEYHSAIDMKNDKLQGNGNTLNVFIEGNKLKKRPGKTLWGVDFNNTIDGLTEYIDDLGVSRLIVASDGNVFSVTSTVKTALDTGLTRERLHFNTHRGRLWCNGKNTQRKITNTTAARVGIEAPAVKPAVVAAGTGLTGSYAWKFTYCIKENGVVVWESNPSPVSDSLTLTNEGTTLSSVTVSSDSRVNCRQIYRTTAGGSSYQYEGEIDDNTTTTFTSGSVTDATLGAIVETNHGVPVSGEISEGCNERMFWIVNSSSGARLYYSEQAHTEAYQEYQSSLNYKILQGGGLGTGLKRVYNINTAREDLYIFQENGVSILPNGDPYQPLLEISNSIGCVQHDTISVYNNKVLFMAKSGIIYIILGNRLIDISTRSWVKTGEATKNRENCRASVIIGFYYAITTRTDLGKLYNHTTWLCDLRSIREVQDGIADANWLPWEIDADYIFERVDKSLLIASNKSSKIYSLSFSKLEDDNESGGTEQIIAKWRTKNFGGESPFVLKTARYVNISGKQEHQMKGRIYYGYDSESKTDEFDIDRPDVGVFIVGVSVMGSPLSSTPQQLRGPLPNNKAGNYFSFAFTKDEYDRFFEINGFQFTFNLYSTGVL